MAVKSDSKMFVWAIAGSRSFIIAAWVLAAIGLLAILAAAFQYGARFRYETIGGIRWRVDEFTGQRCRVIGKFVNCAPPASASTSTSTSLSVSTSTSVKASHPTVHKRGARARLDRSTGLVAERNAMKERLLPMPGRSRHAEHRGANGHCLTRRDSRLGPAAAERAS